MADHLIRCPRHIMSRVAAAGQVRTSPGRSGPGGGLWTTIFRKSPKSMGCAMRAEHVLPPVLTESYGVPRPRAGALPCLGSLLLLAAPLLLATPTTYYVDATLGSINYEGLAPRSAMATGPKPRSRPGPASGLRATPSSSPKAHCAGGLDRIQSSGHHNYRNCASGCGMVPRSEGFCRSSRRTQ
jgi:hypothetical protein